MQVKIGLMNDLHTFSSAPYPIESMAAESLVGNCGEKAFLFLFNQPSGAVTTNSSNSKYSPSFAVIATFPLWFSPESIDFTFVENFIDAFCKTGCAIVLSIL
jgi:hypothetical protein